MHSSRMRTGRSLTVCCSVLPGGGGSAWSGGVLLGPGGGGVCLTDTCKNITLATTSLRPVNITNTMICLSVWRQLLLRLGHLKSTHGRSGKLPERGRPIVLKQLLLWWLNSPWAPGHICGVSAMLVVVVVLLFSVLVQGLTR